jgi:hypothetical protein
MSDQDQELSGIWEGATDQESQSPGCVGSIPAKRMAQLVLSYSLVGSFLAASVTPGAGRALLHERAVGSGCRVAARPLLA